MEVIVFYGDDEQKKQQAFYVRDAVFTKEQGYPAEIDIDEYDECAWHVIVIVDGQPVATARLINSKGVDKIGRVAVLQANRGVGLGAIVVNALLIQAQKLEIGEISLHSQKHAQSFYERLGFEVVGNVFLEDGQPHIAMKRTLKTKQKKSE